MSPATRLPAIQFYPSDWKKDPGIQALDFHHRGVWFEILLLMHESDDRGKLLLNSKAMPDEALARILGLTEAETKQIVSALEAYGVASRDPVSGALINRRMVRDEAARLAKVEAGRKGGKISRPPKLSAPNEAEGKQSGSKTEGKPEANRGSSVSTSTSLSKKDGASPDVGENLKSVYGDLIRAHWWQGDSPPPKAPDGWELSRDLNIVGGWETQGYQREDLVGALLLYEGEPATLAIAQRSGNRFILNDLIEAFRKRRELEDMRVSIAPPRPTR
jgi:hypothetical protein